MVTDNFIGEGNRVEISVYDSIATFKYFGFERIPETRRAH
jgi:hypothetical protein